VLASLFALGHYYNLSERIDIETIRGLIAEAGVWGWLLYVGIFAAGEFVHVPGLVFVAAGILVWGKTTGFALAYIAAVVSVCFSFVVVRQIGGVPLRHAQNPRIRKALIHLERHPVRTVAILRLVFMMAAVLNYALALTPVRLRDYFLGSAIGLLLPVALAALLFDWLITVL
jgi:uncharacterized membrane protein YdjX (TVP38/TMEM64 family)